MIASLLNLFVQHGYAEITKVGWLTTVRIDGLYQRRPAIDDVLR